MKTDIVPPTTTRVERSTNKEVNRRIRRETARRVSNFRRASPARIDARLSALDREWDIERTLEANAALASLAGLALGRFVSRRFYVFPAIVAGFLLQHAVQGWCPPLEWFRRLGVRTPREIEQERGLLERIRARRSGGRLRRMLRA